MIRYYCPSMVSKSRQLESALREAENSPLEFHTHDSEEECPGFDPSRKTPDNCWTTKVQI